MKPHVRNGKRAKARRVEAAETRAPKTLVDCDCEVKGMRPADKAATGGGTLEKGY